jgi:alpha-amylase
MMTGGYYEPIMSVIPDRDKIGQIRKLSDFVKEQTGYQATGMWLAERIWEPHLPEFCVRAGAQYMVLDDSHFKSAGLGAAQLYGYYLTEEQGAVLSLFPVAEQLRYAIPFQAPEATIDFLRSIATEEGDRLAVYADDGEKFGIWPGTYKHCYEDGWLDSLFTLLEQNLDWINIVHFSEALNQLKPAGRVYLPAASYREMMEWAMPAATIVKYEAFEQALQHAGLFEENKEFVRGGFWRNFLGKYPESNNMHKKMLRVSERLARLSHDHSDKPKYLQAQDHLWAGQCNCAYWHGVFGGLYLNHLRYAIYHQLIQSEACMDALEHLNAARQRWLEQDIADFDGDGHDEVLFTSADYSAYFAPEKGGSLFELDLKRNALNLLDTMTRRPEAYHQKLVALRQNDRGDDPDDRGDHIASIHDLVVMKEEGLEQKLRYDRYQRHCLLDHFLADDTTLDAFSRCDYDELGTFIDSSYEHHIVDKKNHSTLLLSRQGTVDCGGQPHPVKVAKEVTLPRNGTEFQITYVISNSGEADVNLWFAAELDFALLAGDAPDRYYAVPDQELEDRRLCSIGELRTDELHLIDKWLGVDVALLLEKPAVIWRFPIETISQSEGGFERVYQSSVVVPNWRFKLAPGQSWHSNLTLKIVIR